MTETENQSPIPKQFAHLTMGELYTYLRIKHTTFYNMLEAGNAPPTFKIGGRRFARLDAVNDWLAAQAGQGTGGQPHG